MSMNLLLMMFITTMFIMTSHPLVMGLSLMLMSVLLGVFISMLAYSSWLAYMLIMVFVSGMMIIILYMASLSSNEIVSTHNNKSILLTFILLSAPLLINYKFYFSNEKMIFHFFENTMFSIVYKVYSYLLSPMTLFIIFYLLIVLIVAVNIINTTNLPLKTNK